MSSKSDSIKNSISDNESENNNNKNNNKINKINNNNNNNNNKNDNKNNNNKINNNNNKNNNNKNNNNNNKNDNNYNSKYSISSKGLLNIINFSSKISSLNENKTNLSLPFVSFYPFYPKLNVNLNLFTQSSFSYLNDLNLITEKNDDFNLKINENNNKESKEILTEYENMLNRIYNIKSSSSILNSSILLNNKNKQLNSSNNFTIKNNNNNNNNKNSNSTTKNNNSNNNNSNINNSFIEKISLNNSKIITENNEIGNFYMNSNTNLNKSSENLLKNSRKKKSKIDSNLNSTLNEYYLKQTVNRNNLENYQTTSGIQTVDKNGKKIEGSLIKEKEGLQSIFIKKMAHKPRINVRNDFLSENEKKIYANEIKKRDIVNVTKCENLLEKNLTRNFTPDMKPVRDRIKKRDMKIKKKKGIPQIEYKVDFESIKKKNDQIELTKTLKFKQSLMNKSKNFNNNNNYY